MGAPTDLFEFGFECGEFGFHFAERQSVGFGLGEFVVFERVDGAAQLILHLIEHSAGTLWWGWG